MAGGDRRRLTASCEGAIAAAAKGNSIVKDREGSTCAEGLIRCLGVVSSVVCLVRSSHMPASPTLIGAFPNRGPAY